MSYADYDVEKLHLYAGIDTYVTSKLLAKLAPSIYATETLKGGKFIPSVASVNENLVMPALEFILDLELNGISYDVEKNKKIGKSIRERCEVLAESFNPHIGSTNVNSDDQLGSLLYKTMELPVVAYTKTGTPSTDGDTLKKLAETTGYEWLSNLAVYKDLTSIYNTFIGTYVEDFVKSDGRLHPTYNLHGTSGFRISGEDPNLTQLPKAKHGYNIRECYKVPEGYVFLALDYSSAEVKVLANICRDKKLLEALAQGLEPHTFSASKIFKLDYQEMVEVLADQENPKYGEYRQKRQLAKAVTFGILEQNRGFIE